MSLATGKEGRLGFCVSLGERKRHSLSLDEGEAALHLLADP
jgi:hypothetical protein